MRKIKKKVVNTKVAVDATVLLEDLVLIIGKTYILILGILVTRSIARVQVLRLVLGQTTLLKEEARGMRGTLDHHLEDQIMLVEVR
jgi:hypothetical protein